MMLMLQIDATTAVALSVATAAVCRLAGMHLVTFNGVRHKASWVMVYLAMLVGSLVAVYEAVMGDPAPSTLILLTGAGVYLLLSRVTWTKGPPAHMQASCARQSIPEPFGLAAGQAQQSNAQPSPGERDD
jgi:uncharacterized membrane protein YfcA